MTERNDFLIQTWTELKKVNMKISEILKKDFIIPDINAPDKLSALSDLSRFLDKKEVIKDKETNSLKQC